MTEGPRFRSQDPFPELECRKVGTLETASNPPCPTILPTSRFREVGHSMNLWLKIGWGFEHFHGCDENLTADKLIFHHRHSQDQHLTRHGDLICDAPNTRSDQQLNQPKTNQMYCLPYDISWDATLALCIAVFAATYITQVNRKDPHYYLWFERPQTQLYEDFAPQETNIAKVLQDSVSTTWDRRDASMY